MIITFVHSHDTIQRYVHQETSYLAKRRFRENTQGEAIEMMDELVMDSEHDYLFRRLFQEAKSEIIFVIKPAFIADTPTDLKSVFAEYPDYRRDRDFALYLDVPNTFPVQYHKSIDTKIQQYLIDYILWRWLETKAPEEAATFKARLEKLVLEINNLLNRKYGYYPHKKPSFP